MASDEHQPNKDRERREKKRRERDRSEISAAGRTNKPNHFLTGLSMFFLKSLISLLVFSLRPLSSWAGCSADSARIWLTACAGDSKDSRQTDDSGAQLPQPGILAAIDRTPYCLSDALAGLYLQPETIYTLVKGIGSSSYLVTCGAILGSLRRLDKGRRRGGGGGGQQGSQPLSA